MSKASKPAAPKDFETALGELEALVAEMEAGKLNLEAALAAYRRGMELTAYCQKTLADAEREVRILENGVLKDLAQPDADDDE